MYDIEMIMIIVIFFLFISSYAVDRIINKLLLFLSLFIEKV